MAEWQQTLLVIGIAVWVILFITSIVVAADSGEGKIMVYGLLAPFFIPHLS